MRFADLPPAGRAIIVAVGVLTAAVAAAAFATSYGALYSYARETGLYSDRLTRAWPLLFDAAFIVAQLAAILAGMLRASRGWPFTMMVLTAALTIWFNLQHAGADPGRRLAAAIPPVLMILAFEIDLAIVKWTMRALGRPLSSVGSFPTPPAVPGTMPGVVGGPAGSWSWAPSEIGPNGQPAMGSTKRAQVEAYLDQLGQDQATRDGAPRITRDLAAEGVDVSERYVRQLMEARAWPATPTTGRGSAGSNGHKGR